MTAKLLIIEDNEQDQKIMKKILARSGFEDTSVASDGEKGVVLAEREKPDIILVDTVLPGKDGFEVCRELTQVRKVTAKVIMMTGRIDAVDADKARAMGAEDYCVKTSDFHALVSSVKKIAGILSGDNPQAIASAEKKEESPQLDSIWGIKKTNEAIRTLYKELEKKTEELKKLDKLKSEFVATVSHELRTPLALINGAISQTIDGVYGEITDLQKEKLTIAHNGAKLLKRIIDDLLDISRLEAGEVKLNKDIVDLCLLAKEVFDFFLDMAKQKGIVLKLTTLKPAITVVADRDRIVQVITNLVGNAIKFTDHGEVEIIVEDNEKQGICKVRDTGIGIAEEDLPKVFERFQQFGKKFGPGQEGTGLGLSICKSILELHNGSIFLQSEKGTGTTFTFILDKRE